MLWDSSPLSAAEEEDLWAGQRELWSALQRAGREVLSDRPQSRVVAFAIDEVPGIDPETLDRVADLNQGFSDAARCRCAIVASDPEDARAAGAGRPYVEG